VNKLNSTIGRQYPKGKEPFSWAKFKKIFYLGSSVEWIKSIKEIIDLRKLIIYLVIGGLILGYGWAKGRQDLPINVKLGYGKEAYINLNGEQLHIDKKGNVYLEDDKGNIIKQIKAKDIKGLKARLAPLGLQLNPFALVGAGSGIVGDGSIEAGGGISLFRIWKANVDAFLTNRGIYGGLSYKLTDNSGIGGGIGKGWKGDTRGIIYYKFEF